MLNFRGIGRFPLNSLYARLDLGSLCRTPGAVEDLSLKPGEPLQIMLGVPAHANSNQRFLTVEDRYALSAGFDVLRGFLNET